MKTSASTKIYIVNSDIDRLIVFTHSLYHREVLLVWYE